MNINLYNNKSDPRDMNPKIYLVGGYVGTFKKGSSIMNITLEIRGINRENMENLSNVNYCYIPQLKTYYHLSDIEFLEGNIVRFLGREDVLQTYKNEIKNLTCTIERQENRFNQYLSDPLYKVYSYKRVQTFPFPSGFDNSNCSFVLAVQGGA